MERKESEIMAEAYGELARAYKKLRAIFLNRSMVRPAGTKSPQILRDCSGRKVFQNHLKPERNPLKINT